MAIFYIVVGTVILVVCSVTSLSFTSLVQFFQFQSRHFKCIFSVFERVQKAAVEFRAV
jgi:hypothetical protein